MSHFLQFIKLKDAILKAREETAAHPESKDAKNELDELLHMRADFIGEIKRNLSEPMFTSPHP